VKLLSRAALHRNLLGRLVEPPEWAALPARPKSRRWLS
jgi:transposase